MEPRQHHNRVVLGVILGGVVGFVLSVFRERIAQVPALLLLDAVGIWTFYLSNNLVLSGFASTIYAGLVCYLITMLVVRGRFRMVWGVIGGVILLHVVLIWRLDILHAPSIGEGLRFLFAR